LKLSGAGRGFVVLVSRQDLLGAIKIRIRRQGL
jgi:hypothetical protein